MQVTRELLRNVLYSVSIKNFDRELWIWGAGNTACLYQEGLRRTPEINSRICGYCDSDKNKQTDSFYGKRVISPEKLPKKNILVLICSANINTIKNISNILTKKNIEFCLIDHYIMSMYREQIMQVYDILEDDKSKNVYANLVLARIFGMQPTPDIIDKDVYFIVRELNPNLKLNNMIDCGAYTGDTFEQYLWSNEAVFDSYIGFEPDANNMKAFEYRLNRLSNEWNFNENRIMLYPYGVGNDNQEVVQNCNDSLAHSGVNYRVIDKEIDINDACKGMKIVAIDKFINQPFDFLKADIESFEYGMILGSKKSILKYKPTLAICIYHNGFDFFQIALLVKKILPEYKIEIRHHCYDTTETVLYAWCE